MRGNYGQKVVPAGMQADSRVEGTRLVPRLDVGFQVIREAALHLLALGAVLSLLFPTGRAPSHRRVSGEVPSALPAYCIGSLLCHTQSEHKPRHKSSRHRHNFFRKFSPDPPKRLNFEGLVISGTDLEKSAGFHIFQCGSRAGGGVRLFSFGRIFALVAQYG